MATAFARHDSPRSRFTDDMFSAPWPRQPEPKPPPEQAAAERCPFCDQRLPHARSSILSVFGGGIRRLAVAIWMILFALIRTVRLAIAGCLYLVGLVGACCRALGVRIAHPDDRRFFVKSRATM
jgi:hypothetical protein